MKFFNKWVLMIVGILMGATAWAGPAVEQLHGEAVLRNAELQAQVDQHAADLADLGARHDDAQAAVASLQDQLHAAEAALADAVAALHDERSSDQAAHLDTIDAEVQAMLAAIAVPVVELVQDYGFEEAATMIAARLGVDPLAVSALLAPAPAAVEPSASVEAEEVTPAEPVAEDPEEVPAESGDEQPVDGGGDSQ